MLLYWGAPVSERSSCSAIAKSPFNGAVPAQAATVIFSLQQIKSIAARSIRLCAKPSAMKILMRNTASLRAAGRHLYWPAVQIWLSWNRHSRCLTMIRKRARGKFSRYVPEDITALVNGSRSVAGFQK